MYDYSQSFGIVMYAKSSYGVFYSMWNKTQGCLISAITPSSNLSQCSSAIDGVLSAGSRIQQQMNWICAGIVLIRIIYNIYIIQMIPILVIYSYL